MKWFANMKISKKLLLGFSLVLAIAVAIGAIGIINLMSISANDAQLYQYMTVPMGYLTQLTTSFQMIRVSMRESILVNDPSEIAKEEEEIALHRANLDAQQEAFAKLILSERVRQKYDEFLKTRVVFGGYLEEVLKLARENRDVEALALMQSEECYQAEQNEQNAILELVSMKDEDAAKKSEANNSLANAAMMTMVGSLAAGAVLAILLALYISRLISGSMKKIIVAAEGIADGDLSVDVGIDSKDEIGELASTFRRMTGNLNEVLSGINAASEQVSLGAAELSNSSVSLSQGATEQASSIEEVTASLEQISSQTKQNAQNASEANKLAGVARSSAEHGNDQMKDMLKAMEEINASSNSISKIIKVIDDIAFQTNILALNAAVEAARAGQYGKGFAVVAEEVRNLAAKSANAAKETTDMIESSIRKVEAGTKLATQTAEELEKIVDGVAQTAVLVNQIDLASKEQAIGLSQINQAVIQVSQVVQANSAVSEQSAAASKELAGQAETMRVSVGKFKLKKDDAPQKLRAAEGCAAENAKPSREAERPAGTLGKRIIALSDGEFGKY